MIKMMMLMTNRPVLLLIMAFLFGQEFNFDETVSDRVIHN